MRICYIHAFSGISGDMTVGALLDAGADFAALAEALASLGTGASFRVEKTRRRGIAASKFYVDGGEARGHRHLPHITRMIEESGLPDRVKRDAVAVFQRLGEAEGKVHGTPVEKVHFHEVGAVDSICDIVGACFCLDALGVEAVYSSAVNVGSGTVNTEHGVMPVPAPATAELLRDKPVYSRGPALELTTPTGAALAVTLASGFGAMPPMSITAAGYGAGDYDFPEHANVLRVMVGEAQRVSEATTVAVIESNIDDASPQVLGYAMERLLEAGALDVTLTPLVMKKNRPGTMITVIAQVEDQERLAQLLLAETSSLGLRLYTAERRVQAREFVEMETPHGRVRIKVAASGSFTPEYEDCRRIAAEKGLPLRQVMHEASLAYLKSIR
ncbi:MAG: nickel pincer cofactor biosynthesis protein LarC [Acidobacteria bacterium]|nr:nickel pincer cofactor biosynthesis protein LarC [Acidobacteriota bacterium]